ncbi:hypothetical protein BH11ARM2_BH11ARM2_38370 [soil metagenome]
MRSLLVLAAAVLSVGFVGCSNSSEDDKFTDKAPPVQGGGTPSVNMNKKMPSGPGAQSMVPGASNAPMAAPTTGG